MAGNSSIYELRKRQDDNNLKRWQDWSVSINYVVEQFNDVISNLTERLDMAESAIEALKFRIDNDNNYVKLQNSELQIPSSDKSTYSRPCGVFSNVQDGANIFYVYSNKTISGLYLNGIPVKYIESPETTSNTNNTDNVNGPNQAPTIRPPHTDDTTTLTNAFVRNVVQAYVEKYGRDALSELGDWTITPLNEQGAGSTTSGGSTTPDGTTELDDGTVLEFYETDNGIDVVVKTDQITNEENIAEVTTTLNDTEAVQEIITSLQTNNESTSNTTNSICLPFASFSGSETGTILTFKTDNATKISGDIKIYFSLNSSLNFNNIADDNTDILTLKINYGKQTAKSLYTLDKSKLSKVLIKNTAMVEQKESITKTAANIGQYSTIKTVASVAEQQSSARPSQTLGSMQTSLSSGYSPRKVKK